MTPDTWKKHHKAWVKARNAAKPKVASGAVKGVSIGKSIDAVVAAFAKDLLKVHSAAAKLVDAIKKYRAAIQDTNKELATWMGKELLAPAEALVKAAADDAIRLVAIQQAVANFKQRKDIYFPDGEEFHKVGMAAANDGVPWAQAAAPLNAKLLRAVDMWRDVAKAVNDQGGSLQVELPKRKNAKFFSDLGNSFTHEADLVANLATLKSLEEFQYAAKGCRDSFWLLLILADEAIKGTKQLVK